MIYKITFKKIILSLTVVFEIITCNYEQLATQNFQLQVSNITAKLTFDYCLSQVCSQYPTTDTTYLQDYQYFYTCTQSTYSCSQTTDFEIFYDLCLDTCYYNVTAKFASQNFKNYIKCQSECLNHVQTKVELTNENQTTNYPFYSQYLKCYQVNCSSLIIDNANQQNFQIYRQIFQTCYTNQNACLLAVSNYNLTQIEAYCYNSCITFIETSQNAVSSDSDFTNLLNCDSSCLNQTIEYQEYYLQQAYYEIYGAPKSLDDSLKPITIMFWVILGIGSFILCFITIFIAYHMKVFSKMQNLKYDAKFTESDEEGDEDEYDQNQEIFIQDNKDEDGDENEEENYQTNNYQDIKGYQYQGMVKRSAFQDPNSEGIRKLQSAEQEVVDKRIKFKKRSKVTLVDENINIEIQDNDQNEDQADDDYIESAQNKTKKQDDIDSQTGQQEIIAEQENEPENSIHYDFARDKSKNVSMNLNSHKNLKEKPQSNWRDSKFQNFEFQENQRNRKLRISAQENSHSPPHKQNSQQNSKLSQKSNNSNSNKTYQNNEVILEMQNYTFKQEEPPQEIKQPISVFPQPLKIDFDKLFQQNNDEENNQQSVEQIEEQEKIELPIDQNQEVSDQLGEKKRRLRRSIISPSQTPNQLQSNQMYSEICFEQSPQSQTNKQIIQKKGLYQSKTDQTQFNQILNKIKNKSKQENIDSTSQYNKEENFEINSPDTSNQQNQFNIPQNITDSVYQYQQQHKVSINSKTNQILSSQTVDESRFISASNQQELLQQMQNNNQEKRNSISSVQKMDNKNKQNISEKQSK